MRFAYKRNTSETAGDEEKTLSGGPNITMGKVI